MIELAAVSVAPEAPADTLPPAPERVEPATPPEPVRVAGDRDELLRLMENLVENAIKYGRSDGEVEIAVTDTAILGGLHIGQIDAEFLGALAHRR